MSAGLRAIGPREASIFACLVDAFVRPEPPFPPVSRTRAVDFFDSWLEAAPAVNRASLRILLHAAELAPIAAGGGRRLRRLEPDERTRLFDRLEHSARLKALAKLIRVAASLAYYGDPEVMRLCGYDPEAKVRAARELREREGRP